MNPCFIRRLNSKKHILYVHENIRLFQCDLCDYKYPTHKSLKDHKESVHEGKKLLCKICENFYAIDYLPHHIALVHDKTKKKQFLCHQCSSSFFNKSAMENHIRIVHNGLRPFPCPICEKKFPTRSQVSGHIKSVHNKEKKSFDCEVCNAVYNTSGGLDSHKK